MKTRATILGTLTFLACPAVLTAQRAVTCPDGEVAVTTLEIGIRCDRCSIANAGDPTRSAWSFSSEPVVESAPADGPLRRGDVIVAVDGHLITTASGGSRFARPEPGRPSRLTIRRDGRQSDVDIDAVVRCRDLRAIRATAAGSADRRSPIDSVHVTRRGQAVAFPSAGRPIVPSLLPDGWLGISFQCSDCQVAMVHDDSVRVWTFTEPPTIVAVEDDSPAYRAGLRAGDRITAIDGASLTSPGGGRRFGAVAPGQTVSIDYVRDGRSATTRFTAGNRAVFATPAGRGSGGAVAVGSGSSGAGAAFNAIETGTVRYTGQLGDTMIEVTGEPVTVYQQDGEIVIRSSTVTVRLRREGGR